MKDLKRLLGYMGPYKKDMALGMLLVIVESAFEMVIPILMSDIIARSVWTDCRESLKAKSRLPVRDVSPAKNQVRFISEVFSI